MTTIEIFLNLVSGMALALIAALCVLLYTILTRPPKLVKITPLPLKSAGDGNNQSQTVQLLQPETPCINEGAIVSSVEISGEKLRRQSCRYGLIDSDDDDESIRDRNNSHNGGTEETNNDDMVYRASAGTGSETRRSLAFGRDSFSFSSSSADDLQLKTGATGDLVAGAANGSAAASPSSPFFMKTVRQSNLTSPVLSPFFADIRYYGNNGHDYGSGNSSDQNKSSSTRLLTSATTSPQKGDITSTSHTSQLSLRISAYGSEPFFSSPDTAGASASARAAAAGNSGLRSGMVVGDQDTSPSISNGAGAEVLADPLKTLNQRMSEIKLKEQRQNEEMQKIRDRTEAKNRVVAEKRDSLLRQYEEEDARAREAERKKREKLTTAISHAVHGDGPLHLDTVREAVREVKDSFNVIDPHVEGFLKDVVAFIESVTTAETSLRDADTKFDAAVVTIAGNGDDEEEENINASTVLVQQKGPFQSAINSLSGILERKLGRRLLSGGHPIIAAAVKQLTVSRDKLAVIDRQAAEAMKAKAVLEEAQKRSDEAVNRAAALGATADQPSRYAYVRTADRLIDWLEASEARVLNTALPQEISQYIPQIEKHISELAVLVANEATAAAAAIKSGNNGFRRRSTVRMILEVSSVAQKALRAAAAAGGDVFLCVLIRLLSAAVSGAEASPTKEGVVILANVVVGLFHVLPDEKEGGGGGNNSSNGGKSLQQQGAQVFQAMLYRSSRFCIPDFEGPFRRLQGNLTTEVLNRALSAVQLLGSLVATQNSASPASVEDGWVWLTRAGKQLQQMQQQQQHASGTTISSYACNAVRFYLGQASASLVIQYGWNGFSDVLNGFKSISGNLAGSQKLVDWVNSAVSDKGSKLADHLRKYEPHVMSAYMFVSSVEDTRQEVDQIDAAKPNQIMDRIREIGINRIVGIFNRLSKVEDKIVLCVNDLLNLVVGAGGAKDMPVLLNYTLYKIAQQIVKKSSEEHFIINDEAHPIPIARLAVGITSGKPEIAEVVRAVFYSSCPITVPRQPEPGLDEETQKEEMGYLRSKKGQLEDSDAWRKRMTKILCTFSVMCLQPEGTPFSLSDAWAWLANMVNSCSRIPRPYALTADALDIFLRITSSSLYGIYGQPYLAILRVIRVDIVPKLIEDIAKHRLIEFLDGALVPVRGRNGPIFAPFFKPAD